MDKVLGRYTAVDLQQHFAAAGLLDAVMARGFAEVEVSLRTAGMAMPHIELHGSKDGRRGLLLEACINEMLVQPSYFDARGATLATAVDLLVAYWVREQDPTRPFPPGRPPLPLQEHPGLGVLPVAFRALRDLAQELGKDGVACMPKFFHDAYIFYHSRLFSFLDPSEQGRFQKLLEDLSAVPLGDISRAFMESRIIDEGGRVVVWDPGYLVCPMHERLTGYFNSNEYSSRVDYGETEHNYSIIGGTEQAVPTAGSTSRQAEEGQ